MDDPVTDLRRVVGALGMGAEEALDAHLDGDESISLSRYLDVGVK